MNRISLAFVLVVLACGTARADDYTIKNANGSNLQMRAKQLTGSGAPLLPLHGLADPNTGSPFTIDDGQPIAPAVTAGYPVSRSVIMTGAAQQVMAAATTTPRKAGYCQASYSAVGTIAISITGTAAAPPNISNDAELVAGQSFDLNQHGYAEQGAVSAYGTHAGDVLMCQEVQ